VIAVGPYIAELKSWRIHSNSLQILIAIKIIALIMMMKVVADRNEEVPNDP
jgi:hypothetical protein